MTDASLDSGDLADKLTELRRRLAGLGRIAVAYSGGVDSTYLLAAVTDTLGRENTLAVTVASELTSAREIAAAQTIATQLGVEHLVLSIQALSVPGIAGNPPERCYHCKWAILQEIRRAATERGFPHVVHGANRDDRGDYRPGARAAAELGVHAPLDEVGLTKAEIRALSRQRGLPTWDQPAQACLATRVPYHVPLTRETLQRIQAAEDYLHARFGLPALRVRDHFPIARIEVPPEAWPTLLTDKARLVLIAEFHRLGYVYVTLDLAGLRSGSMNDVR